MLQASFALFRRVFGKQGSRKVGSSEFIRGESRLSKNRTRVPSLFKANANALPVFAKLWNVKRKFKFLNSWAMNRERHGLRAGFLSSSNLLNRKGASVMKDQVNDLQISAYDMGLTLISLQTRLVIWSTKFHDLWYWRIKFHWVDFINYTNGSQFFYGIPDPSL